MQNNMNGRSLGSAKIRRLQGNKRPYWAVGSKRARARAGPYTSCLTRGPGARAGAAGRGTKTLDWQMRRGVRARPSNIQPNFCASCDWGARKKERKSGIALVPNQMWRTRARVLSAGSVFFWSFLFFCYLLPYAGSISPPSPLELCLFFLFRSPCFFFEGWRWYER